MVGFFCWLSDVMLMLAVQNPNPGDIKLPSHEKPMVRRCFAKSQMERPFGRHGGIQVDVAPTYIIIKLAFICFYPFLFHKMGEITMATFMQDWPRTNWQGWIVLKLTKTIKKKTGYACIIGKNYRKPCVVPLIVVVSCKLSFISPSELIKWYRSQKRRKQSYEHLFLNIYKDPTTRYRWV